MGKLKIPSNIYKLLPKGLFFIICYLLLFTPAYAQDPASWQQNATGLKTTSNTEKKTAGLGFIIQDQSWPFISMMGNGVQDGGYGKLAGPVDIDLGLIKIPSAPSGALSTQTADWSHNELNFNSGQLKVTASRLTPSLLLQSSASQLRLMTGNVQHFTLFSQSGLTIKNAPSSVKYVAYSSGGTIQVKPLSTTALNLPALDQKWLMVWYGTNAHFVSTKTPILYPFAKKGPCCDQYTSTIPYTDVFQADAPILLTFENSPTSISQSSEGGFDLNFTGAAGSATMMPLFGSDFPKAADTESWSAALPATVTQKINFWVSRACNYPLSATENYNYDSATDKASITDSINYVQLCTGSKFAPIPPILSVAKDSLAVSFSAGLVDSGLQTMFGPLLGIDNVSDYNWSISGLNKYISYSREIGNLSSVPPEIIQNLVTEVDKLTQAGHMQPWFLSGKLTFTPTVGDYYFVSPADSVYLLTEVVPILPEPQKTNLVNFLKSERSTFPPETQANIDVVQGKERGDFNTPEHTFSGSSFLYSLINKRLPLFYKKINMYNFYALSRYYATTGETVPVSVLTAAKSSLDGEMAEQDFATGYWFKGFDERKTAVENANRYFAGLIGLARISTLTGDSATENLSRALMAKAAVMRAGMASYPKYMYSNNLITLPADPLWQPRSYKNNFFGILFNYDWKNSFDDARQVTVLNQFGLILHDNAGFNKPELGFNDQLNGSTYAYLSAFKDMVPETAIFLRDYVKNDVGVYIKKYTDLMPNWFAAFSDTPLGDEHGFAYPVDSYQLFLAKELIEGESANNLAKYSDISWLSQGGDLFYIHKLAETAKVYAGSNSTITPTSTPATPTPSPKPGDIDLNGKVDIFDYNILLTNYARTGQGIQGDLDNNGKVDIFDYNILLTNFGK